MHLTTSILPSLLWQVARASQPGAAEPVAAPIRDLTWGKLNFLHTTDTHGWLGGHLLEPQYSADWGDYVSFAEHMRRKADDKGVDLLVIDTGDRVEGNGLYDASSPTGLFTYDIFAQQTVDLLCTGNHELYKAATTDREHSITVPKLRDNYMASNLDYYDAKTGVWVPQAQRYRKFTTKNQGLEIISFGFLFDFTMNANNSRVQPVAETLKEEWFLKVLREENPDVFVIIGHVGLRMPEFRAIFETIRKARWYTPILFFGGHAHVRDARKFDAKSYAIASGRYGETIGWASVDGIKKRSGDAKDEVSAEASISYSRKYIDTNLFGYYHHTGLNESTFDTAAGKRVRNMISRARKSLDLDNAFGCAPRDLWMNRAEYPGNASIYTWLEEEVLQDTIVRKDRADKARLAIANTGTIRFDIFKGPFTKDSTYTVLPFTSKFRFVPDVPYKVAKKVIQILNHGGPIFDTMITDARFMNVPEALALKDLSSPNNGDLLGEVLDSSNGNNAEQRPLGGEDVSDRPRLIGGYTTKDDLGTDGDDTEHSALTFYQVPNCVQAEVNFPDDGEPETVDLVFLDFIQQWVLLSLKFSGGDYGESDVQQWDDETLTYKLGKWISDNWKGDC
ncbi:ser/Thr protein phosphatase family [Plectosphaerella plurivora]|uniref:Ser/Thr protein phosphatase family n=1 Tax=Plectosphaerella plurivora TaxID=936078 RepID=A0A9P9A953_9PEZI|nr:ser/Thr protein phosphatase family [Plectosphaerella plurivora]